MRASRSLSDRLLYRQVATLTRVQDFGRRLKNIRNDQKGQTPTEYLMIVGLMAAVIVLVFVTFYWKEVKASTQSWVKQVKDAIVGKDIK
jgi:Flp pilus assembly pilin Flp